MVPGLLSPIDLRSRFNARRRQPIARLLNQAREGVRSPLKTVAHVREMETLPAVDRSQPENEMTPHPKPHDSAVLGAGSYHRSGAWTGDESTVGGAGGWISQPMEALAAEGVNHWSCSTWAGSEPHAALSASSNPFSATSTVTCWPSFTSPPRIMRANRSPISR